MKKHNLHVHSTYSDGNSSPEEMLRCAREEGLEVLGFAEHGFTNKTDGINETTLLPYIDSLRRLQQQTNGISLRVGLEIDFSKFRGVNPDELPFEQLNKLDYVLFEYIDTNSEGGVFMPSWNGRSLEELILIRNKLLIPVGLAHNDMQVHYYKREQEIARMLAEADIFVELSQTLLPGQNYGGRNSRIGRDYYKHFSKELIEALRVHGVKFVIGTDNHNTLHIGEISDAIDFIAENDLRVHEMIV